MQGGNGNIEAGGVDRSHAMKGPMGYIRMIGYRSMIGKSVEVADSLVTNSLDA